MLVNDGRLTRIISLDIVGKFSRLTALDTFRGLDEKSECEGKRKCRGIVGLPYFVCLSYSCSLMIHRSIMQVSAIITLD